MAHTSTSPGVKGDAPFCLCCYYKRYEKGGCFSLRKRRKQESDKGKKTLLYNYTMYRSRAFDPCPTVIVARLVDVLLNKNGSGEAYCCELTWYTPSFNTVSLYFTKQFSTEIVEEEKVERWVACLVHTHTASVTIY